VSVKSLPLLLAALMAGASIPYALTGDWRRALYWAAAAVINVVVTI
jgi:hypothetical protein